MPATWLRPELVCMVKYTEVTKDGNLRHPIFAGLREDKKATDEKNERVVKTPAGTKPGNKTAVGKKRVIRKKVTVERAKAASMVKAPEKDREVTLNKHALTLTNLNKVYWPKEKITKGDMIRYYEQAAEFIMPYLKDRPQSLNRYPNGIDGESFYQKNVGNQVPDWMKTYRYKSESDGKYKQFLVATDKASLIYMANLGCIEMNPWNSRIQKPDNPDWCVIDIDPDKINTFNQVIEVAKKIKTHLDQLKITAYCKTSGSTGMHIYIPLAAKYTYDQSRMFAEMLVTAVQRELPDISSIERSLARRKGKIYLDFLQNRQIQTIAAPYSLRPKPGATVSMPLHWEEVKPGLKISDFNIHNALSRMQQEPDIFKGVLGPGINLNKVLATMEKKQ
jgi:bifunctional non-homologous end joining protein LigD